MSDLAAAKSLVRAFWSELDASRAADVGGVAQRHLAPGFRWQGFAPLPDCEGTQAFADTFLIPFRTAFPDYKRDIHIFCGGISDGRRDGQGDGALWVGATGYISGQAATDFAGIPATGAHLRLRWAEFYQIENGQIIRCQHLVDLVDWLEQTGRSPLPRPTGVPHVWPAPTGYVGDLITSDADPDATAATLALGRDLIFGGLNSFDGEDLSTMGMARFFHSNVKWYGPGGIGACLSLDEFTTLHQEPWLVGFPDRQVGDLDNLFAEDRIVAGSSFPGVTATHSGPYQGVDRSGAHLDIHGIDFWLRDGDRFTENWVYVDFVHLFAQMGVDLLEGIAT